MSHDITREIAEQQLEKLFEYYEIELEKQLKADNAEKAQATADDIRDRLTRAIMKGRLEICDDEESQYGGLKIVQRLRRPVGNVSQIVYGEVTGRARTAIKDVDKGSPHAKVYSLLGAISKEPVQVFMNIGGVDLTCAETLAAVFSLV